MSLPAGAEAVQMAGHDAVARLLRKPAPRHEVPHHLVWLVHRFFVTKSSRTAAVANTSPGSGIQFHRSHLTSPRRSYETDRSLRSFNPWIRRADAVRTQTEYGGNGSKPRAIRGKLTLTACPPIGRYDTVRFG